VAAAGVGDRVEVVYSDYRDLRGSYSHIASIEMFEAVGYEYWGDFFAACARLLAPGGSMVMQTIIMPDQRFAAYRRHVDWTQKHIFPGSLIPALGEMIRVMARRSDLVVRQLDDIGPHYAPTLRAWRDRFLSRLPEVRALGFDDRFIRTWELYLAWSEASFAEHNLGDAQITLTHAS
jgi:cyclopropane-fatty-acyl-phospholipid synthase